MPVELSATQARRRGDSRSMPVPGASQWRRIVECYRACPDEIEQNVMRLIFTAIVAAYAFFHFRQTGEDVSRGLWMLGAFSVVSIGYFVWIYLSSDPSTPRRVLYTLGDRGIVTALLLLYGEWAAVVYIIYPWIDIGNPARYGTRYLLPSTLVSVTGFTIVLALNPYWRSLGPIGEALWLMLLLLPLFSWLFLRKLKAVNQRLADLATRDALTGLPNRPFFYDQLRAAIAAAERHKRTFLVMFIDIDNFKEINDTLGHDAGDEALRDTANALRQAVRQGDCVARLGGDEFVVLLHDVSNANPYHVGDNLREVLGTYTKDRLSASIGVAGYPVCGTDAESLVRHADQAMYVAKKEGKHRCRVCSNFSVHKPSREPSVSP